MRVLVTGFEPFNGESLNPSELLAKDLASEWGAESLILPVSYRRSFQVLRERLERGGLDGVLSLGQAAGRAKISLEKVALNLEESEYADVDQNRPLSGVVAENEAPAIFNDLPLRDFVREMRAESLPVELSTSAGTYVCNSLYYQLFQWRRANPDVLRWHLFVHVPFLPEQLIGKEEGTPAMSYSDMQKALRALMIRLKNPP